MLNQQRIKPTGAVKCPEIYSLLANSQQAEEAKLTDHPLGKNQNIKRKMNQNKPQTSRFRRVSLASQIPSGSEWKHGFTEGQS